MDMWVNTCNKVNLVETVEKSLEAPSALLYYFWV